MRLVTRWTAPSASRRVRAPGNGSSPITVLSEFTQESHQTLMRNACPPIGETAGVWHTVR